MSSKRKAALRKKRLRGAGAHATRLRRPAAAGPRATYALKVPCATGRLNVELAVPRGPIRLADMVPLAQHLTNEVVEQSFQVERQQGRQISCRRGCTWCCRQLVPLSAPEAFRLADAVVGLDEAERDAILERFERGEELLQSNGLMARLEALTEPGAAPEDLGTLASDFYALGLDCPLLKDDLCVVHAERPLCCRHYSVTTPAEWCADPRNHAIHRVPTPPLLSHTLARLTAKLAGAKPILLPLNLAMRWVDANAELGFREWPGLDLFRAWLVEVGAAPEIKYAPEPA